MNSWSCPGNCAPAYPSHIPSPYAGMLGWREVQIFDMQLTPDKNRRDSLATRIMNLALLCVVLSGGHYRSKKYLATQ